MLTPTQSAFGELDDPSSPALVPSNPFHHQPGITLASSAPMPSFEPTPSPLKYSKLPGENEMADDMLTDDCVYPTLESNKVATIPLQTILELEEPETTDQERRNDRSSDRSATKSANPENQTYRSQQKHQNQNNREVTTTAMNTDMNKKGNKRPCSRRGNSGHHALDCLSQYGSHSRGGRGRGQVQHDSGSGGRGALRGGNQAIERVRRGSRDFRGLHGPPKIRSGDNGGVNSRGRGNHGHRGRGRGIYNVADRGSFRNGTAGEERGRENKKVDMADRAANSRDRERGRGVEHNRSGRGRGYTGRARG
jgi:hypothetical protein